MMHAATSLRLRLLLLFVVPLVLLSAILGTWRVIELNRLSTGVFDRTLLSTAIAISRDVVVYDGDLLGPTTRTLLSETAGGTIFYHVNGPDGSFATGYAYPPVAPQGAVATPEEPVFYTAQYKGEDVRVVRLRSRVDLGWISGFSTVSVWQELAARETFFKRLASRTGAVIGLLVLAVAGIAWFGVRFGLRPLTDLEDAIERRSPNDLSLIRRAVPPEVGGIVRRTNALFSQVSDVMTAQSTFISDAAHQLRNPIAGILSLAEASRAAATTPEQIERSDALLASARHASRLANQLLTYERVEGSPPDMTEQIDLTQIASDVIERCGEMMVAKGVDFEFAENGPAPIHGDAILLSEAVQNLVDNAVTHNDPDGLSLRIETTRNGSECMVTVADSGAGIASDDWARARARFSQLRPGPGSGLGLAIADAICAGHGGEMRLDPMEQGTRITLAFPNV